MIFTKGTPIRGATTCYLADITHTHTHTHWGPRKQEQSTRKDVEENASGAARTSFILSEELRVCKSAPKIVRCRPVL